MSAIDVLEVKYLPHFAKNFARLTPPARAARKALGIVVLFLIKSHSMRRLLSADAAARPQLHLMDRIQAVYLTLVWLGTIGAVIYWIAIAFIALLGVPAALKISIDDIFAGSAGRPIWILISIALFVIIADAVRRTILEPLDQWAAESFAGVEYQINDKHFLAVPSAILDAIEYARQRGNGPVDLVSFSLGSLLATDVIFPRKKRERVCSQRLAIDNWVTIGYPYDLVRRLLPDYFKRRQEPVVEFRHWINVVVKDDFLATNFTKNDERGIHVLGSDLPIAPDTLLPPFKPEGHVGHAWWDVVKPLRRVVNHRIYWNDEDARAPTCFREVVDKTGWTEEVLAWIKGPTSEQ